MKIHSLNSRRSAGFTLIELLIVITIIAILAGVAFTGATLVGKQAKKAQAKSEVMNINNAVTQYRGEYRKLPKIGSGGEGDERSDEEFMAIIMAYDDDMNPKGIAFYEGKEAKGKGTDTPTAGLVYSSSGRAPRLVDPWGEMYYIKVDADYDKEIAEPGSGEMIRQSSLVWSQGDPQDEGYSDTKKWIKSW